MPATLPLPPELQTQPTAGLWKRALAWLRFGRGRIAFYSEDTHRSPEVVPGALTPEHHVDRFCYGLAQPLLGLRILLRDKQLLIESLIPAFWLAAGCAIYAWAKPVKTWHDAAIPVQLGYALAFGKAFVVMAPLPSLLFANHYARMAALVRYRLGFGTFGPREMPLWMSARRWLAQAILVSFGVAPFLLLPHLLPGGTGLTAAITALWSLQWIVIDALDDARVLRPGETLKEAEAEDALSPAPWFVRLFRDKLHRVPLSRALARWFEKLSTPWRGEFALAEANPALSLGFGLATATLLATPVLNLLFRPVSVVASAHLVAQLEAEEEVLDHHEEALEGPASGRAQFEREALRALGDGPAVPPVGGPDALPADASPDEIAAAAQVHAQRLLGLR